eukprot:jgi/Astpho2/9075/gw1.00133.189.1_t
MCCAPAPARNLRLHEMRRQAHLLTGCWWQATTPSSRLQRSSWP